MSDKHPTGNTCPVCGYTDLPKPTYSKGNTGAPSFEICPSCGFQPGYDDDDQNISHEQWREQWIAKGMPWYSKGSKEPLNWNPRQQLLNI